MTLLSASVIILCLILSSLFMLLSKSQSWDHDMSTSFECGFNSFYFSRHSFSVHFVKISLIFLFLDLELCVFLPFLLDSSQDFYLNFFFFMFFLILLLGLMVEWKEGKLEWSI